MLHLGARSEPRFFVDPSEVRSLAARFAAQHPESRTEAIKSAGEWRRYIYVTGDPPFAPEHVPDWNDLPFGPGRDNVYATRPHYFLFAVQLARACVYGAQSNVALSRLVESWLAANDGRAGTHAYSSPLIAVHRAVALTWTLAFLAGWERRDLNLEFTILRILLADARFVHSRLGTSYANNHLLADGFLMLYLGLLYPEFREAEQWRHEGQALFLRELRRQIYEDGTSFEHSVHYHELACEMVTAFVLLAQRNGIGVEPWVERRHRRMLEFQARLGGPEARSFDVGDTVEAHLFPLDGFDGIGAASHREVLRALYCPGFPPSRPDAPGLERAQWLLGQSLEEPVARPLDEGHSEFPDGGYVVLPDSRLGGCVVFRTGPRPGALCSSGHMHADFLSVYLRLHGTPIIVDAGTFTYRSRKDRWPAGEPEWRAHFRSTAAHNALCIESHDPLGRSAGDFPSGPLGARVVGKPLAAGAGIAWVEATVASDTPYGGHTRGVVHVGGHYWLVYDVLPPAAIAANAWLGLHFPHDASVCRQSERALVATIGDAKLRVASSQGAQRVELFKGARTPLAGWISPRYGELVPAPACRVATTGGAVALATLFEPVPSGIAAPTIDLQQTVSGGLALQITRENRLDYLLLSRRDTSLRTEGFGIDFEGSALWLRVHGRVAELRTLAGRRASSKSLGFSVVSHRGPRDLELVFGRDARHGLAPDEVDVEVVLQ
jgi:hypothetical protein